MDGFNLGSLGAYLPMLILLASMYFFLVLPQKRQQKKRKELLDGLQIGDEIVTIGGIVGRISQLDETTVMLKLTGDTEVKFLRSAVSRVYERNDA